MHFTVCTNVNIPTCKSDNFDTIGIETIRLILFLKMLLAQGFSAPVPFLLVSL